MSFLDDIKAGCLKGWEQYKILPSLTAAQAILESGWGKHAPHNALFGIKADASWTGKSFNSKTQEEYQTGVMTDIVDRFRAYDSWTDSIVDHGKFLNDNPRYQAVIGETDYKKACYAIKAAGYATASGYAELLIQLIEENDLQKWDEEVIGKGENAMTINTEQAIAWMSARQGKVTYSMDYRNGPSSYDCSSSIYFALRSAGASDNGWAVNTEYEHEWLVKNGYQLVAENELLYPKRGDIGIWGKRGYSAGSGGHTFMFLDDSNIIHCNYGYNGITVNDYNEIWYANGQPYEYLYRYTGSGSAPVNQQTVVSQFERELDVNTPLSNSNMPYYEATVSEDYYVESKPDVNSEDKELLKAGTRVRVYEKLNGWARIGAPQSAQWVEDSYLVDATDM